MKKSITIQLSALLGLIFLWSIYSFSSDPNSQQKVLRHVVSFQFKDELTAERKAQAIKDFVALKDEIPEIKKFEGGEDISVEGLDKEFTHCFILTFENEEARDSYIPHPAHLRLVEKNKPLMKDIIVLDVWGEE